MTVGNTTAFWKGSQSYLTGERIGDLVQEVNFDTLYSQERAARKSCHSLLHLDMDRKRPVEASLRISNKALPGTRSSSTIAVVTRLCSWLNRWTLRAISLTLDVLLDFRGLTYHVGKGLSSQISDQAPTRDYHCRGMQFMTAEYTITTRLDTKYSVNVRYRPLAYSMLSMLSCGHLVSHIQRLPQIYQPEYR